MILWRISNYADLTGQGGIRFSARWHSKGNPIVYCAESPAGALNEMLVHFEKATMPDSFRLLKISVPDKLEAAKAKLPKTHWQSDVAITREIGDHWLKQNKTALLRVPSIITPETFNMLVNPAHQDARNIKITKIYKVPFDERLKD